MMNSCKPWLLAASFGLAACGDAVPTTAFDAHTLPESSGWGQGLEGFGTGGTAGDTGGTGGSSSSQFDGTWEGPYSLLVELTDYAVTCSCSADLTLVVIEGDLQVGFGESCTMTDCGITSQLAFGGSVGADGGAAGTVEEDLSFFFTVPWSGTFTAGQADASFSEVGLSTSQGTANVSGSFTVLPAAR
jgi:hypothetical protein